MNKRNTRWLMIGTLALILLLAGCGAPEATPTVKPPAATATQAPAADTPTVQPPAATATTVPPTDAPAPTAEPPTPTTEPPTSEPPTPTSEPPTPTSEPPTPTSEPPTPVPELSISTTAFEPDGEIPSQYSCLGDNLSPALAWTGVPAEAESLVLLVYDLDAGAESGASTPIGFAHWLVYDIPPGTEGYSEDQPAGDTLADGALQGSNDFAQFLDEGETFPGGAPIKLVGYDGPCPGGKHRYTFHLHALDSTLDLPAAATLAQVLEAMEGHVLADAQVVGTFEPPQ